MEFYSWENTKKKKMNSYTLELTNLYKQGVLFYFTPPLRTVCYMPPIQFRKYQKLAISLRWLHV